MAVVAINVSGIATFPPCFSALCRGTISRSVPQRNVHLPPGLRRRRQAALVAGAGGTMTPPAVFTGFRPAAGSVRGGTTRGGHGVCELYLSRGFIGGGVSQRIRRLSRLRRRPVPTVLPRGRAPPPRLANASGYGVHVECHDRAFARAATRCRASTGQSSQRQQPAHKRSGSRRRICRRWRCSRGAGNRERRRGGGGGDSGSDSDGNSGQVSACRRGCLVLQ